MMPACTSSHPALPLLSRVVSHSLLSLSLSLPSRRFLSSWPIGSTLRRPFSSFLALLFALTMSSGGGSAVRRALTPIDILRNCRGKPVSLELCNGETINGVVMRTDRAMNVVLKQSIRTGADGETFWRARESFVRGASVRNVRMDESALKARPTTAGATRRHGGTAGGAAGKKRSRVPGARVRPEEGAGSQPARKQARK